MIIRRDTSTYNERRYGKPWIAHITIEDGKLAYRWGSWIGTPGQEGVLELSDINPGDAFAKGQKDNRKPQNSAPTFYVLGENGKGGVSMTKAEIYKYLLSQQTDAPIPAAAEIIYAD